MSGLSVFISSLDNEYQYVLSIVNINAFISTVYHVF